MCRSCRTREGARPPVPLFHPAGPPATVVDSGSSRDFTTSEACPGAYLSFHSAWQAIQEFLAYFEEETAALGDDSLSQEVDLMKKLLGQ